MVIFAGVSVEAPWSPQTASVMALNLKQKRITLYNLKKRPVVHYIAFSCQLSAVAAKRDHGVCDLKMMRCGRVFVPAIGVRAGARLRRRFACGGWTGESPFPPCPSPVQLQQAEDG